MRYMMLHMEFCQNCFTKNRYHDAMLNPKPLDKTANDIIEELNSLIPPYSGAENSNPTFAAKEEGKK
jgi:hypothetical protein